MSSSPLIISVAQLKYRSRDVLPRKIVMKTLLSPAFALMQHLRLWPKFLVVSILFALPALWVGALLLNELNQSIELARQERDGIVQIRQINAALQLMQQHRAQRHVGLAGNKEQLLAARNSETAVGKKLAELQKTVAAQQLGSVTAMINAWHVLQQSWQAVPGDGKPRENYAEQSALIAQLYRLSAQVANQSNLSLDPEVDSHALIALFAQSLPQLTEGISDISGRGAAFIDTGLLQANEDVLLNSATMLAGRDLQRIEGQLDMMLHDNPAFKPILASQAASLGINRAFLQRTKTEVLNSLDQTSGQAFLDAGMAASAQLEQFASACANLLDTTLAARVARKTGHRNALLASVACALLFACWLLGGFYATLAEEVTLLSDAVKRVSAGDLQGTVSSHSIDEIGQLLNAFDGMRVDLSNLVTHIHGSSATIASASQQIAHGNADLSNRTEEQASSIQETSASMAALTRSVQHNDEGAEHASQRAQAAGGVARDGAAAILRLIQTMNGIEQSSKKISDIIGVINGIAFQTNILALNAAVEAARAGEQGRGFAIVASEVRNLAQRSGAAAKEIDHLITSSSQQVAIGSQQVQLAGNKMQDIVDAITSVTDTMQEITRASAEQRSSIEHVNAALRQIDGITQQNSALVEQAAAAAESMYDQARNLTRAVSVFQIAEVHDHAHKNMPDHAHSNPLHHQTAPGVRVALSRIHPRPA
jgi:methyl-accepting chemotaxis protein